MSRIFEIRTRRVFFGNILFPDLIIHNPVTFIKGTSGCGKSTLLRLLMNQFLIREIELIRYKI